MSCYRPITAFKPADGGPVLFVERKDTREIKIRCGQCIGCRIDKRDAWAVRCYAESKMHNSNTFVTFTYDDEHLPVGGLKYRDFQLMLKRLREKLGSFRFFMCGEYGEQFRRPHYHALFFGLDFPDKLKCNSVYSSSDLYQSEILNRVWGKGMCTIGEVTWESARYCAVYTTKKINGDLAETHYSHVDDRTGEIVQLTPEFARMSLKPGIGLEYIKKYWADVYLTEHDAVVINGVKRRVPRYFDEKLKELYPDIMEEVLDRKLSKIDMENNSRIRLEVRERCALAKERFNKERKGYAL